MSNARTSPTPPGGPSTFGGIIYQMLWCLLRLAQYEHCRIDRTDETLGEGAVLVLEPSGGGGDARVIDENNYVVTQVKCRSDGGTWSLQEVITGVLPDLVKAVKLDAAQPVYEFVTDGRRGDWEQVERAFRSLRNRECGNNPIEQLDNEIPLRVGARIRNNPGAAKPFWTKDAYTEREVFVRVCDVIQAKSGDVGRSDIEKTVWHLLGHFEFRKPLSQRDAENQIDEWLLGVIEQVEDLDDKRRALLMRLAEFARDGNATVELSEFFGHCGLDAIHRSDVPKLLSRCRSVISEQVGRCGFDRAQHVQEQFTEALVSAVHDAPVVMLVGESGSGKSWHSYAIADELSQRNALVAHIEARADARATLDTGLGVLWNTVKGQDGVLPFYRAAKALPGPPPVRVLIVDQVEDPMVARQLARAGLETVGVRLVLAVGEQAASVLRALGTSSLQEVEVPLFSPMQLEEYLSARRVPRNHSIPSDVRDVLLQPMLARIYCDISAGSAWAPSNEYELFSAYWNARLGQNSSINVTLDLPPLRDLARDLLDGQSYPWRAGLVRERVRYEGSLERLSRSGWFVVHPEGECAIWHDRLLNWLVADMAVEDFLSGRKTQGELEELLASSISGDLRAGGRWLGYVALDALWLLAKKDVRADVFASMLTALESPARSALYKEFVPTLGERSVAGLLARLDQVLDSDESHRAVNIASCLAQIASPEAVAKARQLLLSESPVHHTVALQILRRNGDPVSLDRLWALHVDASQSKNPHVEYERRMDALESGIKLKPEWLEQRLSSSTADTASVTDLVYLLARFPNDGVVWRSLKDHLKAIVPEHKRRCLVRCITVFKDRSEIEYLRHERNRDEDLVGGAALASLAKMSPDTAISDLETSELKYLAFTRGWHLHRLLAARPKPTIKAIRNLTASARGWALALFSSAENDIDPDSFNDVLDVLEAALVQEVESENPDANSGPVYEALSFIAKICRPDLLRVLKARHGTELEDRLVDYLMAIGPRERVNARLCDRAACATIEYIGSERLKEVAEKGLDAPSWYGRIDAVNQAHKHASQGVVARLRTLADTTTGDDNDMFVAYAAANSLAVLEDWDGLLPIIVNQGLAISPYVFEERRDCAILRGERVDEIKSRVSTGGASPGVLLGAGFTRDPSLIAPIITMLTRTDLERDQALSASIALDLLDATDTDAVDVLCRYLHDDTLRDRFLRHLLSMDTVEARAAVFEAISVRFDVEICALLGESEDYAMRSAQLAWENREASERSVAFANIVPLFGRLDARDSRAYLERLANGIGRLPFGRSVRAQAIRGLQLQDPDAAFAAAESSLRDYTCEEREAIPRLVMELNRERAIALLIEQAKTIDDEIVELSIAEAVAESGIQDELVAMLGSESPAVRRIACVLVGRHANSSPFVEQLRELALDEDECVVSSAISALDQITQAAGVSELLDEAIRSNDKARRWVLLDRAAKHAMGTENRPAVAMRILTVLHDCVSPLEAKRFNESMNKGRDKYRQGVRRRANSL